MPAAYGIRDSPFDNGRDGACPEIESPHLLHLQYVRLLSCVVSSSYRFSVNPSLTRAFLVIEKLII
jgi:hypothetical protein